MSLLTIIEVSRQFSIGRTSIYKAIKNGELTPQLNNDGVQVLNPQDIIRIFGNPKKKMVHVNSTHRVPEYNDDQIRDLKEQIKELKEDKEFLRHEIANIRKDFDDYKLAITYKENEVSPVLETDSEIKKYSFKEQEKLDQVQRKTEKRRFELAKDIFKKIIG